MADVSAVEKLRVFISYSREDSAAFAEELLAGLELAGFSAFVDRGDITAGRGWQERLSNLIAQSDTVVFVISPKAIKSERCLWELDRTIELSKRLVPVLFKPVPDQDIPEDLSRLQFVRFDTGRGISRPLAELADALRLDLDWIREHTRLGEIATGWEKRGRPEALLLRGGEIDAAKIWMAARNAAAPEITALQRAFVRASEEAEAMQREQLERHAEDVARLEKEVAALRAARVRPNGRSASAKVFISYRREDSRWPARQIYEAFKRHLPPEQVFIDIDSIPPGADFVEILEHQVGASEMVLALIGPGWLRNADPKTGRRRLDDPKDFVRIEICAALSRAIPVVPVLLEGAPMPEEDQLPGDMRMLVRRQAEFVEYRTFDADVDRLIKRLGLGKQTT
jgi:hypothetical protein